MYNTTVHSVKTCMYAVWRGSLNIKGKQSHARNPLMPTFVVQLVGARLSNASGTLKTWTQALINFSWHIILNSLKKKRWHSNMVSLFKNSIYCDNTSHINKCIHSRFHGIRKHAYAIFHSDILNVTGLSPTSDSIIIPNSSKISKPHCIFFKLFLWYSPSLQMNLDPIRKKI